MKLLGIDTSGKTASVALCDEQTVLAQMTVLTKLTHSQVILPICKKLLSDSGVDLKDIDGIAVADGPGSYTGLRIGIAAVKAMCFALDKPCIGVSTLEALAYNFQGYKGTICSVMSARQNLVYNALFHSDGKKIERSINDRIISADDLLKELINTDGEIILTGDFAEKFFKEFCSDKITLAPPHLRLQLASSLCYSGFVNGLSTPERLTVRYLQPTKAEKDLGIFVDKN